MSTNPYPSLIPGDRLDALRWMSGDFYVSADHLIISPHVITRLVEPEASTQPNIAPHSAILHSNAGPSLTGWERLIAYWRRNDISGEAHFQVGFETTVQAMPLNRRADCNYRANRFYRSGDYRGAISFETADRGYPTLPVTPWTVDQLSDIIGILVCLGVVYGVACTAPATWDDSGIGHHVLFPEWSSYIGKSCPGAARIRQMDYIRSEVARRLAEYGAATGWRCGRGYVAA